jgi:hypothetical protein
VTAWPAVCARAVSPPLACASRAPLLRAPAPAAARRRGMAARPRPSPAPAPHPAAAPSSAQVGAAAAFGQTGALAWGRCLGLVAGAICVIAWLNLRCADGRRRRRASPPLHAPLPPPPHAK